MLVESQADYSPAVNLLGEHGRHHSDFVEIVSSGGTWEPTEILQDGIDRSLEQALADATPPNSVLIRWARNPKNAPDQSWWDDTTDPFEAERD